MRRQSIGRVAKIFGVENYAPSMGALRSDQAISGPSNRFTDLVEGGEQASRRAVRRRFFRALNVCDTPAESTSRLARDTYETGARYVREGLSRYPEAGRYLSEGGRAVGRPGEQDPDLASLAGGGGGD